MAAFGGMVSAELGPGLSSVPLKGGTGGGGCFEGGLGTYAQQSVSAPPTRPSQSPSLPALQVCCVSLAPAALRQTDTVAAPACGEMAVTRMARPEVPSARVSPSSSIASR